MMYEGLLHTVAEQSRKIETLKASMARNGHTRDLEKPSDTATQRICILDATTGVPGPSIKGTCTRRMRVREVSPATTTVEHYSALIECLMQEIEAKDHDIGHGMRCRMKDDIIRIHKREARTLSAAHGHRELRDLMRGRTWRLAEMDDERGVAGDPSVIAHGGIDSLPAVSQNWNYDLQPCVGSQDLGPHKCVPGDPLLDIIAPRRQKASSHSMSRKVIGTNLAIERFLEDRDDPWHPERLAYECSESDNPNTSDETSWLPFQRSGTSTVVTDGSHGLVTTNSFEDLPALTDSPDTGTYVSARSVIGEHACDSDPICLVEDQSNGPLAVLADQGYEDTMGNDGGKSGVANVFLSMDELLAGWVNVV